MVGPLTWVLSLLASNGINAVGTYSKQQPFHLRLYYNNTEPSLGELAYQIKDLIYEHNASTALQVELLNSYAYKCSIGAVRHKPIEVPFGFFDGLQNTSQYPEPDQFYVCKETDVEIMPSVAIDEEETVAKQEQWMEKLVSVKSQVLELVKGHGHQAIVTYQFDYNLDGLLVYYNHTVDQDADAIHDSIEALLNSHQLRWKGILSFAHYNYCISARQHTAIQEIPEGFFTGQEEVLEVIPENPFPDYLENSDCETCGSDSDSDSNSELNSELNSDSIVLSTFLDTSYFLIEPSRLNALPLLKSW